ncbi:MAG TPA: rhomboid family intramembrane serine protease, partial [Candidatus Sulfotelmatobacter sp.]|nr:rhomboid family intramembrane serine protease [Candidatus Sulfotelmatobacter sp.]
YILTPDDAVGASGAIFGLFGVLGTALWFYKPMVQQARGLAQQIAILVIINLVLDVGLDAGGVGIDIFAHIGGLLAGIWLGLVIVPRGVQTMGGRFRRPGQAASRNPGLPPLVQVAAVIALVAVIGAGLALGTQLRVG